jgi:hypothetical protein
MTAVGPREKLPSFGASTHARFLLYSTLSQPASEMQNPSPARATDEFISQQ